jgi:tetratricopeptide (TPR) repeat protein
VYLSDFGLTKGSWSSTSLTSTGHFMGTLDYSAPEQIRGQQVDARTDEYALACVAFVLLSGQPPFHRNEAMAVMYAHLSVPPPALTSLRPGLPPAVDEIMQRALAKAPEDRYPSCGEFADALRVALGLRRYSSDPALAPQPRASADEAAPLAVAQASLTGARAAVKGSDEAVELYQRTLASQRHTLGPDHPDTLGTRFNLAREMAACGDHAGAEEEFRAVFTARLRRLGPDHHETLIARFNIAQQMAARGNHAHAEEEFRGLLTGLRRKLGPNHPDTLATWFSIAQQQAARGDDAGAEKEFRYMLPHLRSRLGPDNPVTLIAWFSIVQQLAGRGDDARAEKDFRDMLPHLRSKLGLDHPNTLAAAEWISYLRAKRGEPTSAVRPRG